MWVTVSGVKERIPMRLVGWLAHKFGKVATNTSHVGYVQGTGVDCHGPSHYRPSGRGCFVELRIATHTGIRPDVDGWALHRGLVCHFDFPGICESVDR